MKRRNQLLALVCLLAFGGFGVFYFQHWVVQKPFAIILFIGEGLAPHQLAAARLYAGGADARLSLDSMNHVALLMNASKDFGVPDQAAVATAIATGVKVNNGLIAIDADGKRLNTLIEIAHDHGRATGLVTNVSLTNPTCAAFYAHTADTGSGEKIAQELVDSGRVDIVMGGGIRYCLPENKGGQRQDNRDLLLEMSGNGFDLVRNKAELEGLPAWRRSKLLGLFANDDLAFEEQLEEKKEQPSLGEMVRRAIELLQYNASGYLLVVDSGLLGKAAESNSGERTLSQTLELDRAVATARRYAGRRSTILVCGDVGIGGMSMNGFPFRRDSGLALLGLNSSGEPWITWASGPKGTRLYGAAKLSASQKSSEQPGDHPSEETEPAAFYTKPALKTVDDVLGLGTGYGTESLEGITDVTTVFKIIRTAL